jgi:hypothetical protein
MEGGSSADDPLEREQVRAMLADELLCTSVLCGSACMPLPQPPGGRALVKGRDVELVHHEHAARLQQLREAPE